jgi:glycosyltransferase involved in cell wall biosynthesis
VSSSAASHAQAAAAARRHLVFVGGTSEPGGLHIHTADIARSCADLGCRVTILCTSINYFASLLEDDAVAIEVIGPLDAMGPQDWLRILSRLGASALRPRIVFCCGSLGDIRIVDLAAAYQFGTAVYTIIHRPCEEPWRHCLSKTEYGRLSSEFLTGVVAVSEEIAASTTDEFGVPEHKVSTCLNWVSPTFKPPTPVEHIAARLALGIAPSEILIAFLGRLSPQKRVDALLQAFAGIATEFEAPVRLGLFGDGWKRKPLTELTQALGIENRVCFFGWVSAPWSILAACDIFVLPSVVEGFPLALMEAMATGCACLAHPMASTMRLIENGTHGMLADLSDSRSFATALRAFLECGPAARSRMGLAAAARVASEYSRARRLPKVLSALGLAADVVPEFCLRTLEFNVSPA